jgi:hypothetical protein
MEKKRQANTPLGDKFNDTDFGFEPAAWADMEALLAQQEPKPSLSIPNLSTLLLLLVAFGFIISWGAYEFKNQLKSNNLNGTNYENKRLHTSKLTFTTLSNIAVLPSTPNTYNVQNTSNSLTINELERPATHFITPIFTSNPQKALAQSRVLNNQNSDTPNAPNALFTEGGYLERMAGQNGGNSTENFQNPQNSLSENFLNTAQNTSETNSNLGNRDKTNSIGNLNPHNLTQTQVQSLDIPIQPTHGETIEKIENSKSASLNTQKIDNQELTTDFKTLESLPLTAISSQNFTDYNVLNEIGTMRGTQIVPFKSLWSGKRHWISGGIGRSFFLADDDTRSEDFISRYRLAYGRRISPLMSIGASMNHTVANFNSYIFVAEVEAQMYLINRKRFETTISLGYGLRNWAFKGSLANGLKKTRGTDRGATLGLGAQYWFKNDWGIAFRYDIKQVVNSDFTPDLGWALSINRRF